MILRQTWLNIADSTTVIWLQTFHLYKGFRRSVSSTGFFVKGSAKVVTPPRVEYKGFKFKYNVKGDICRSIIVRTTYCTSRYDGSSLSFQKNSSVNNSKETNLCAGKPPAFSSSIATLRFPCSTFFANCSGKWGGQAEKYFGLKNEPGLSLGWTPSLW